MASWRRPSKRVLTVLLVAAALTGVAAVVAGEYLMAPMGPADAGETPGHWDGSAGGHCRGGGGHHQHHPGFWFW